MAAAYAALVSLENVLNRIQYRSCPASLDTSQIRSLLYKVCFLIDFLVEDDTQKRSKLKKGLESRIAYAAYAAEDVIESYVVRQILPKSARNRDNGFALFNKNLPKVIKELDLIEKRVIKIRERKCEMGQQSRISLPFGSFSVASTKSENAVVGFEEDIEQLLELLTGSQTSCQIIPIVGMGGIGKTTLAMTVYEHQRILSCFHIKAWVTVSQNFGVREILISLLRNISVGSDKNSILNDKTENSNEELGDKLYKCLIGMKYLIVLDDVWSNKVWDEIKMFLPDKNNGSRILFISRLLEVVPNVGSCDPHEMKLLDDDTSWDLLSKTIFHPRVCPPKLKELGKKLAINCKGLPLAIVVIGGLLKMSQKIKEFWEEVVENINSFINAENDEHCLKVLYLSYNNLPIQLKPCFLYMAYFQEDTEIRVSHLIKLWVSDGFLKPVEGKTPEEVALEHLNDLIGRNLIMCGKRGSTGQMRSCIVHDILRDVSLEEAQKERFLCVLNEDGLKIPQILKSERRFVAYRRKKEDAFGDEVDISVISAPLARSLISNFKWDSTQVTLGSSLLRVVHVLQTVPFINEHLVNLRYLAFATNELQPRFVFSLPLMWNIETLIVDVLTWFQVVLPCEIWKLPYLRNIVLRNRIVLPEPDGNSSVVESCLDNLQTLCVVENFECTDEVLIRIPNLKKLKVTCSMSHSLHNLARLGKLEILNCDFPENWNDPDNRALKCVLNETLTLSPNLIKLTLCDSKIPWEKMTIVGTLPNLEVLKLQKNAFCGYEWNPIEGEFVRLKYLFIQKCDLKIWSADSSHFPQLELLDLRYMQLLEEIPEGIGEIQSLKSIYLYNCKLAVAESAGKLLADLQDMGNDELHIYVHIEGSILEDEKKKLESLEINQFYIKIN